MPLLHYPLMSMKQNHILHIYYQTWYTRSDKDNQTESLNSQMNQKTQGIALVQQNQVGSRYYEDRQSHHPRRRNPAFE